MCIFPCSWRSSCTLGCLLVVRIMYHYRTICLSASIVQMVTPWHRVHVNECFISSHMLRLLSGLYCGRLNRRKLRAHQYICVHISFGISYTQLLHMQRLSLFCNTITASLSIILVIAYLHMHHVCKYATTILHRIKVFMRGLPVQHMFYKSHNVKSPD